MNPASERIAYFVIFVVSLMCLFVSFSVMSTIYNKKNNKDTYVMIIDHKDKDSYIKVNQILSDNSFISFLEIAISKYVKNMESLIYKDKQNSTDIIRNKSLIIKNLSSSEVYKEYMARSCCNDDSDVSLILLRIRKTVLVDRIEFIYEDVNFLEKIYSLISLNEIPKGAKVYFTVETTDEKSKKQHMVATMYFNCNFGKNVNGVEIIDFKVNDYYVDRDKDFSEN